jgi:DNA-binding NtrC family response regulator
LVIDDEKNHRELYSTTLAREGFDTVQASSADEAAKLIEKKSPSMIVSDVRMPGVDGITFLKQVKEKYPAMPYLLITAFPDVRDAVNALKMGAVDYLEKPVDLEELASAVSDALGISAKHESMEIPQEALGGIVAESSIMRSILRDAYRVAQTDANVLITGESGSGKEVIANFIHKASARSKMPFVALNCASIPANILGSELFGHEKGAYTGAYSKRNGLFREGEKGTVFLDEIGDMPLDLQPSLLRVIETGKISPLGSDKEVEVDFRLVTATNKKLTDEVKNGNFREDLYYRLNVIAFEIPPLRERPEDILPLARSFLAGHKGKAKRFSPATSKIIRHYSWPGNARELANAMERASILSNTEIILPEHLPPSITRNSYAETLSMSDTQTVKTMDQAEIEAIKSALESSGGNRTKASELLGISRRALIYKLKRYNIK